MARSPSRAASVALIALSQVMAMALWFSASAVVPALRAEVDLDPLVASLFTSGVQAGFVVGTLLSAVLGLADRLDPRRLIAVAALLGAAANAAIFLVDPSSPAVVLFRFLTGITLAGVYPVGMKLVSTWARTDMGLLVGLLVGALTLGSATPHLFNAVSGLADGLDWRFTLGAASLSAVVAAGVIGLAGIGPRVGRAPPFDPRLALRAWTVPSIRLANLGYLGHMWELYAMWAWIGVFLSASFEARGSARPMLLSALATFAVIAAGGAGCVIAGWLADRVGRTAVTMGAMAASGCCCLAVGPLFGGPPALLVGLCLVWGLTIVADSAQFSASVAELSDPRLVGTMLTVQTSVGFLLTLVTIHGVPRVVEAVGWRWAFGFLAAGPFLGVAAMARLRAHPDARRLAGGRR